MRLTSRPLLRAFTVLAASLLACAAQARMEPMADSELAQVTGQAFINLDGYSYAGYDYTRINFGADIKTQMNIDELRLGEFSRAGDPSSVSSQPADVIINNFGLGRVDNFNNVNALVVPFEIRDPFLEFAYKTNATNGQREIAGLRIGFGKARGDLSGDFQSLTGTMQGLISGTGAVVHDYYKTSHSLNDVGCFFNLECFALSLARGTRLTAEAELVQGGTGNTTIGGSYIKRAEWLGVPKGKGLEPGPGESGLIASLIPSLSQNDGDCAALGLALCFPINSYQSFFVGNPNIAGLDAGGATGIFMAMQLQNVPWKDLAAGAGDRFINTEKGAYMHFPKVGTGADALYPFMVSLYEALTGVQRVPTCVGQTKGC